MKQAISPFLTMSSTLYGTYFWFQTHFTMLSVICFSLDQSKMSSSGNGLKLCEHNLTFYWTENFSHLSKLKAFADDILILTQKDFFFFIIG